jgi:hypothetical protein
VRRDKDYTDILVQGLRYPWPAVAQRAARAVVKLERADLVPELVAFLDEPDPRAPVVKVIDRKPVHVVRELVRINHHRNCMLCHAPGTNATQISSVGMSSAVPMSVPQSTSGPPTKDPPGATSDEERRRIERIRLIQVHEKTRAVVVFGDPLTAQVPVPGEPLPTPSQGYGNSQPDLLVRIDVTYLRQDFSLRLPVSDAHPWPEMQRFDFLVRTRTLTDTEAKAYQQEVKKRQVEGQSPNHRVVVAALRELTGRDAEPNAEAWRSILNLPGRSKAVP